MFETTPPQPLPHGTDPADPVDPVDPADLADLADPVAAVVAVELTRRFIRLCMCQTEPIVARLARRETVLRKPGGIDLEKRTTAQRLYRGIDADVLGLMPPCVPLAHADYALSQIETLLREQFADVVGTAASYLLSDGRDTAIQMATVATTMAARDVRSRLVEVLGQTRCSDQEQQDGGL